MFPYGANTHNLRSIFEPEKWKPMICQSSLKSKLTSLNSSLPYKNSCFFYVHKQYNEEYTIGYNKAVIQLWKNPIYSWNVAWLPSSLWVSNLAWLSSRSWASSESPGRPGWGRWPTRCHRWGSSLLGLQILQSWGSAPGEGRGCCNPGGGGTVSVRTITLEGKDNVVLALRRFTLVWVLCLDSCLAELTIFCVSCLSDVRSPKSSAACSTF